MAWSWCLLTCANTGVVCRGCLYLQCWEWRRRSVFTLAVHGRPAGQSLGSTSSAPSWCKWEQTAACEHGVPRGWLGHTGVWSASPERVPVLCLVCSPICWDRCTHRHALNTRAAVSCLSHVADVAVALAEPSAALRALQP